MTIENQLKELILKRYHSIREFTLAINLPYTTLDSMFRRGLANSSVTNVIKVCRALGISADALADGEIVPVENRTAILLNDKIEVSDILNDAKDLLSHCGFITLDGKPLSKEGIQSIIDAMDVGVEIAKKKQ